MVCIGRLQHYRGGMRTELMRDFWRIFRGGRQESRRRPIRQSPTNPVFEEDVRILRLLKPRLPERPVILDVGASDGRWTREILKTFPGATVFLFEPGTAYTGEMQATLDSHERLKLFPIAIGERDGSVTFHVHPDPQGSTTVDWQEGNFATPTTVPMRTIDSLIKEGEIARPDLIKMDIQAGELAALKGAIATLPSVRALHLETWIEQAYGGKIPLLVDLMVFLRPLGFRLFDLGTQFRKDNGALYSIDACFVNEAFA
jgi:FkbM family methyltransferase